MVRIGHMAQSNQRPLPRVKMGTNFEASVSPTESWTSRLYQRHFLTYSMTRVSFGKGVGMSDWGTRRRDRLLNRPVVGAHSQQLTAHLSGCGPQRYDEKDEGRSIEGLTVKYQPHCSLTYRCPAVLNSRASLSGTWALSFSLGTTRN